MYFVQLDFFKAWHWPTGLADDSREVGFLTRASNLVVVCGCQFVVQFFLGLSLACLVELHFL